jgi:hypothetical protein
MPRRIFRVEYPSVDVTRGGAPGDAADPDTLFEAAAHPRYFVDGQEVSAAEFRRLAAEERTGDPPSEPNE